VGGFAMLKSLTVTNFALLEQASIEFAAGLNVLTGETGAGKSILIDAFNIVLGSRASSDYIRRGTDFYRVEAFFSLDTKQQQIRQLLDEQGIGVEEDTLIISRRLNSNGKSVIVVNNCHVTLQLLRKIGSLLVDMHGQHENQALLKPDAYLEIVDKHNSTIDKQLAKYQNCFYAWQKQKSEIDKITKASQEREQRLDMLTWQTQEIKNAALVSGEEEELTKKVSRLANMEKISQAAAAAYGYLSKGGKGNLGILAALVEVKRNLETVSRYDDALADKAVMVTEMVYQLEEISADLRDYGDSMDYEPQLLNKLQERLDVIYKLRKKYGVSIKEILEYYETAQAELNFIENYDHHLKVLTELLTVKEKELTVLADSLTKLRWQSAAELSREVTEHLKQLSMPNAQFVVEIDQGTHFTVQGHDEAAFLFSANTGEIKMPLFKVASGGELSRLALAIKTVCADRDVVSTLVFDEIDSGIGGQTGQAVAEKIAQIGRKKQVLCITHLPQIAAVADRHIYIEKHAEQERTVTTVTALDNEQRVLELTRMIAGSDVTVTALENARQMIDLAKKKKEKW
jgi:DNA repair protein RecN (Recombination protein N)